MNPAAFFEQNRGAFFPDREAAADYARTHCMDEFAPILLTADSAVEQKFVFRLRWDMEQTKEPVVFEGPIDWLRQPGDDPEFVAFNRMPFWVCMGQAYAL
ncbi:MAG: heparinase, partial [Oscillospiraceae bacterium]|nr:heparinase [Oscillospiraceae bacterium]